MIILSPGALDKVFSTESSPDKGMAKQADSRFHTWLKSAETANPATPSATTVASPYKNRLTRFE